MLPPRLAGSALFRLGLLALILGGAAPALADDFQVSPVRVFINASTPTTAVTVRNDGKEAQRLQVTAFAWKQGSRGEMQLSPTKELRFFPSLVSLPPGEARQIRLGVNVPAGPAEKSYRLIVEQMPPPSRKSTDNIVKLRVLTKMSIPVFLAPVGGNADAQVADLAFNAGKVAFGIRNKGASHVVVQKIQVEGTGEKGSTVFKQELKGWYVLAGGVHMYDVEVPTARCREVRALSVQAQTETGMLRSSLPVSGDRCGS